MNMIKKILLINLLTMTGAMMPMQRALGLLDNNRLEKIKKHNEGVKFILDNKEENSNKLFVTPEQYNKIVDSDLFIKKGFKNVECIVPADNKTVLCRVGAKVLAGACAGGVTGGIVGGVIGGQYITEGALNSYESNKSAVKEKKFADTFGEQYPKLHGIYVWQSAMEADCVRAVTADSLVAWGQENNKFGGVKVQNNDLGPVLGQKMEEHNGKFWKAFPAAVDSYCFNEHNTVDIQNRAREEATQLAAIVAQEAAQKLIAPDTTYFSWDDAKKGSLIGAACGGFIGGGLSMYNGDLTRPIAHTKIQDMNKKI